MNVQQVHKNYNLKNELTDEEFALYKRWCEAINAHEAVAPTTPEPLYMINVSFCFLLFELFLSSMEHTRKRSTRQNLMLKFYINLLILYVEVKVQVS